MRTKNGNGKKKSNGKNGNGRHGRPTRLTKAVQKALVAAIERGHYYITACQLVGISYTAFREWQHKGEAGAAPYADFVKALKAAEAKAEDRMLKIVLDAPTIDGKNWQAAMTFLERRHPDRWGRRDRLDAEHSGAITIKIEWSESNGTRGNGDKNADD